MLYQVSSSAAARRRGRLFRRPLGQREIRRRRGARSGELEKTPCGSSLGPRVVVAVMSAPSSRASHRTRSTPCGTHLDCLSGRPARTAITGFRVLRRSATPIIRLIPPSSVPDNPRIARQAGRTPRP